MDVPLVDLISYRLRARFWLSLVIGFVVDLVVLVPLGRLGATEHPESAGALIAVVSGAIAGPLVGLMTAAAGGVIFFLAAGARETPAGALVATSIWVVAAVISGISVDALRRSRAEQQDLAVALAREEASREAEREKIRLSETLTAALQPRLPERCGDLSVLAIYKPGERLLGLGGDFLDAVALPDGRLALIIGDVAGHGPLAAALGASLRASWRGLILEGADPTQLMDTLNALVSMEDAEEVFVTACLAWIEPQPCRIRVISAGHPRPLILGADVTPLPVAAQPPLGLDGDSHWTLSSFDLPGDCSLFFYTDGLVEGLVGRGRERFGEGRLAAALAAAPNGGITRASLERLVRSIEAVNEAPLPDDVTALALARASVGAIPRQRRAVSHEEGRG